MKVVHFGLGSRPMDYRLCGCWCFRELLYGADRSVKAIKVRLLGISYLGWDSVGRAMADEVGPSSRFARSLHSAGCCGWPLSCATV